MNELTSNSNLLTSAYKNITNTLEAFNKYPLPILTIHSQILLAKFQLEEYLEKEKEE